MDRFMVCLKGKYIAHFFPNVPFLYPLKTLEIQRFSDVFRRCKKRKLRRNGLILNLIQDGLCRICSWLFNIPYRLKIRFTYPTIMKLDTFFLTKENPKNMKITWGISSVLLTSAFFTRYKQFLFYRKKRQNFILIHIRDFFIIRQDQINF